MRRFNQVVAAIAVAGLVPLVASGSASAVATCDVGFTGPNAQNMCTSIETYACSVANNTTVTIDSSQTQSGFSGDVSLTNNTTTGGGLSGSVTNTNGTIFIVTVQPAENVCTAAIVVPAIETPETVQPTAPIVTTNTNDDVSGTVAALPATSGDSSLAMWAVVATGVALVAVIASGGLLVYRHFRAS